MNQRPRLAFAAGRPPALVEGGGEEGPGRRHDQPERHLLARALVVLEMVGQRLEAGMVWADGTPIGLEMEKTIARREAVEEVRRLEILGKVDPALGYRFVPCAATR